ncbi:MAG TPA: sulfotransferase [Steroidobacteraceae bacterium]|jgi:tetratricopeptide (TPR) repeat protein|nr:sulfotransferase [Steroidobacteraceae bacterium]
MSRPVHLASGEMQRLMQSGQLSEALALAQKAVGGARTCLPGHGLLASILLRLGRTEDAESVIGQAEGLATGDGDSYDGLAYVAMALGRHERANALYRRATQVAPLDPRFWYNLACSERSLGRLVEAESACNRAIALDPAQFQCYLLRSELQVQSADSNHIEELTTLLRGGVAEYRAQVLLGYALAKELDDIGRYDEAFRWFAVAAQARRSRLAYDVATDEGKLRRVAEVYPQQILSLPGSRQGSRPVDSSRYIFVVGLPRSGTTLLERILTGLPGARSNGETDNFSRALLEEGRGSGDIFEKAAAADSDRVAAQYARLAEPGAPAVRIIEKLPLNYLYLGAIRRALPEATLLVVSRSPLDSCFAMYRTLFASGYPFSYDLHELGRYYIAYQRLLDHWRSAFGAAMQEIVYEDLVREPQRVGAGAARCCGLPWNDGAVDIQSNKSVSLTASAAQVRRPIYGSSTGRWRHYRTHLEPLIAMLQSHGVAASL